MTNMFLSADSLLRKIGDAGEVIKEEVNTTTMTLGERTAYCLQRTLIGLIIVFGVLAIIMLVLYVSKFIFSRETKPKKTEEKTEAVKNQAEEPAQNDDGEVVAAIIAAITAMREEEGNVGAFRVVSFKRSPKMRPWNQNK